MVDYTVLVRLRFQFNSGCLLKWGNGVMVKHPALTKRRREV